MTGNSCVCVMDTFLLHHGDHFPETQEPVLHMGIKSVPPRVHIMQNLLFSGRAEKLNLVTPGAALLCLNSVWVKLTQVGFQTKAFHLIKTLSELFKCENKLFKSMTCFL